MLSFKRDVQKLEIVVQRPDSKLHFVQKTIGSDTYLVMAQSQIQLEDEFSSLYYTAANQANLFLMPPFEPNILMNLVQCNNTLNQCIEAMEVNIDGTGYRFVPINETTEMDPDEIKRASAFFDEPYPLTSFVKIRRKLRRQMESIGYAFLEVLRNLEGEIVGVRNIETNHVRFVKLDQPIQVQKTLNRDGKEVQITMWERERRLAQRVALKQLVYYREFGTTRNIDRNNGRWESNTYKIDPQDYGTEILIFGLQPDITTPYFVPRWVNELPSVVGSRKAEEQNLQFLDSGGMPPAIIFIQGGTLTKDTSDQLRNYLSGQNKNKFRAVVVECQSSSGSLDSAGQIKVTVERFGSQGERDSMFQKYDVATEGHVQTGFRLPDLFLGKTQQHNFACYDEETEVLTDRGFVMRDQFEDGMKVAAVDPANWKLKFEKPSALSVYDVTDVNMYHFEGKGVDMNVTPKHKMMFRPANHQNYRIAPVEQMSSISRVKVGLTVDWDEGELLTEFSPHSLVKWLNEEVGAGKNKKLPQWMLQLHRSQLRILFDALMAGDGTKDEREGRTSMSYSSVSKKLADQVQEIAFKLGYVAHIRVDKSGTLGNLPIHRVLISAGEEAQLDIERNLIRELYTGKVHCFTVSTGFYVTRRNGKIAIQGNTAVASYMVAEAQVFGIERELFDELINKTIMNEMGFKTILFQSLPITLKDIASQLKGFQLAKDCATRESFLAEINKTTGTDLALAVIPQPDTVTDQLQPKPPVGGPPTVSQTPHGELPASTSPPNVTPRVLPSPPIAKGPTPGPKPPKKAIELVDLAYEYASGMGLVRKRDLTEDQKLIVREKVDELEGSDKEAFDRLLAQYTFGKDDPDLVKITRYARKHEHKVK